jgi:type II secretory pathway component GspD/PulD (secretin)
MPTGLRLRGAFALLLCAGLCAAAGRAEVRVSEASGGRLTVVAHDATIRQVLDALGAVRPLRLHTSDALAHTVTGTYSGPLPRVLSRILDGYDHVVHLTATGVELDIVGSARGTHGAPAANTVAVVTNARHAVSGNVDADDEAAQAAAQPRPVRAPAPTAPVRPAIITGSVQVPDARRVSSNVDLDEEQTSR